MPQTERVFNQKATINVIILSTIGVKSIIYIPPNIL